MRLFAALLVLFSHQYALLGQAEPAVAGMSFGEIGVCIFFSISGYLVTQSWVSDPHPFRFAAKRFLRIWPGLFVAICFCALVIGPLATTLPLLEYLRSPEMHGYFALLIMKMRFNLPGVFLDIPYPRALNGSLWTIPLELSCYAALLIAGMLRVTNFRWLMLAIVLGLAIHFFTTDRSTVGVIANYRMQYGLFFGFGACMWLFRDIWTNRRITGAVLLLAGTAIAIYAQKYLIASLLAIPYASIAFGTASTPVARRFGRFGDVSYGVYIYAFPVQQTVIWATHGRLSFIEYLATSVLATLVLAYLSWHLVEAPTLKLKPRSKRNLASPPVHGAATAS